jgi:predicted enzyme related to lactoylglutathione lyase
MAVNGTFIWNELVCSDQSACGEFYTELLGWECKEVDTGEGRLYSIFLKDGHIIGGMMSLTDDKGSTSSHWEPYIAVDNVDICVEKITRLGGKILTPPHDLPDIGRVSLIRDPSGATVALVTEKNRG